MGWVCADKVGMSGSVGRISNCVTQFSFAAGAASQRNSTAQVQHLSYTDESQASKLALGSDSSRIVYLEESGRLKIDIFNLELCDAARLKVPTDLEAAYAAE